MSALAIEKISFQFGATQVLKNIDLQIESGEFIVLVGPSGCGKSTLLNLIAGFEKVTDGRIEIGGNDVTHVAPKDRDIAMVFQSYALYPTMTVRGNITFGMECRGVSKAQQDEAVARVSKFLQIGNLPDRKPGQLSGGQRQRVAMGRALVRDPVLFLFDEPLSNLDAKLRVEMRMEIKRLHHRLQTTIVYVTHDQIEAMTLATRIAVMNQGVIQQFADPQTIYDAPANLFVARFMGSPPMNVMPARVGVEGDGAIAVITDGGREFQLPLPQRLSQVSKWVGCDMLLGIRPECIRLRRPGDDARSAFTARVEVVEPTGAETMALLKIGDAEVMARLDAYARPGPGMDAQFSVDMRKACLFDSLTEERLC